mmetsp:Transcript_14750/g.31608  ORF Transcript_14750/g.31608 Transcript_14750/m.31608 type:complete len:256 (+) Transcript_14750:1367-2134(+)
MLSDKHQFVRGRRTRKHADIKRDSAFLLARHLPEHRTFQKSVRTFASVQNTRFMCDKFRSQRVITRHHAHNHSRLLQHEHGVPRLRPDGIFNPQHANKCHFGLRRLLPVACCGARKVTVAQQERAQALRCHFIHFADHSFVVRFRNRACGLPVERKLAGTQLDNNLWSALAMQPVDVVAEVRGRAHAFFRGVKQVDFRRGRVGTQLVVVQAPVLYQLEQRALSFRSQVVHRPVVLLLQIRLCVHRNALRNQRPRV